MEPTTNTLRKTTVTLILVGILILAAGLVGGWFFKKYQDKKAAEGSQNQTLMDLSSLPIYNSASQVGSPVVQNPSNAAQNLVNSLQSKQGADLSKSYVEQALMLQNLSVMAAKITLAKTKDPAIIAIANEIIADAAKKIETLKKLLPPEPETNPNQ